MTRNLKSVRLQRIILQSYSAFMMSNMVLYLHTHIALFLNGPTPASVSFIFSLFKQTIQFLQQINVKKCHVHPAYSTRIRTHDLLNMSHLPNPLDQGSHPLSNQFMTLARSRYRYRSWTARGSFSPLCSSFSRTTSARALETSTSLLNVVQKIFIKN